jgi:hypothetical protein
LIPCYPPIMTVVIAQCSDVKARCDE